MFPITLVEAVAQALHYEMAHDKDIIVLGQDVGCNGGVFRATEGLYQKFPERVLDTPLAESMIAGLAIGMATQGLKPVAEFQFEGFMYPAFNQIVNHAARLRNRTRGRLHCPLVFRAPYGGGIHAPEHHSESPEAFFAHVPGLRVVIPSSPAKAYGLLLAAIREPDPVIFFEPKRIYRRIKQNVPDHGKQFPLDKAFVLKTGHDISLITWGALVYETLAAAKYLQEHENIHAEVIDLATIKPMDWVTLLASIEKTRAVLIIHEAPRTCGVGAEIAARVAEHFSGEAVRVQRLTGYDIIMPYARLEAHAMISVEDIIGAIKNML